MNQEIMDFISEQCENLSAEINELSNMIRSKEIEARLIEKKIKNIRSFHDDTMDFLSPERSDLSFDHKEIDKLLSNKLQLNADIELLHSNRNELTAKYEKVKQLLLDEKHASSCEGSINNVDSFKIQEMDRERISRDIHDGVVQNLTALIRKMEFASLVIDQDSERAKLEIKNSKELLKESVKELRNIIYDLRPMSLNDLGFEAAYYNICEKIKDSYDGLFEYNYESELSDPEILVHEDISINILRIIKELCSNSIKYSNGNCIRLSLNIKSDCITLIEEDNGSEFDYFSFIGTKSDHTGFGLLMLNERINAFNGTLEFNNNKGSQYKIVFPLSIRG